MSGSLAEYARHTFLYPLLFYRIVLYFLYDDVFINLQGLYKDFTFLCCWKYNQPFLIVIFSILYRYQCLYVHAACSDCRLFNYGIP